MINKQAFAISLASAFFGIIFATFFVSMVYGAQSSYSASSFAQFCAANSSTCKKVDFHNARQGTISCPATNQKIKKVYVHAGNGQTIWELPDSKFNYTYSNNENSVTVFAKDGTKDISWVGVSCENVQTQINTHTPTPTDTPAPTKAVSATPTATLTPTSTPIPANDKKQDETLGDTTKKEPEVLGVTTLAPTGIFTIGLMQYLLAGGLTLIIASAATYVKEKRS